MKIGNNPSAVDVISYINRTVQYAQQDKSKTEENTGQSQGADTVNLSDRVKEVNNAFAELKKMPEIREEKVGAIQNQVEIGMYQVDAEKTAVSMLNETFENNAVLNAFGFQF